MNCVIKSFLESDIDRMKKSNTEVLTRFIKMKYKINLSKGVLENRMSNYLRKPIYS
jgi:hypothetical protein